MSYAPTLDAICLDRNEARRLNIIFLLSTLCGLQGCQISSKETSTENIGGEITDYERYDSLYGKPLIVLVESDPWLMVIGSDVPTFAMYEKGTNNLQDNRRQVN